MASSVLTILHFNDVYHLTARTDNPCGGAARFQTAVNNAKTVATSTNQPSPLLVFSGDAFNPSIESSVTKGTHMVPVLNKLGVDVCCLGNHDLDFGTAQFAKLAAKCEFPWLCTNVSDSLSEDDEKCLRGTHRYHIETVRDIRVGFIGIVESEWLDTLPHLPPGLHYADFVQTAREFATKLRKPKSEGGEDVDVVVAITHMRLPNDQVLAAQAPEIDLILGGHDHFYEIKQGIYCNPEIQSPTVVKSGTDFRQFSICNLNIVRNKESNAPRRYHITNVTVDTVDVNDDLAEDQEMASIVAELAGNIEHRVNKQIGTTLTPLDGRASTVRTQESNLGNFCADLTRHYFEDVDVVLLCGGMFRSDRIIGPGPISIRDVFETVPFEDPLVVLEVTGQQLWDALENSVSQYPKEEGRFPQIGGFRISFDPNAPAYNRIITAEISHGDDPVRPIALTSTYRMATRSYLANGRDGFTSLLQGKMIVDEENGAMLSTVIRRFFIGLKTTNAIRYVQKSDDIVRRSAQAWLNSLKRTGGGHHGSACEEAFSAVPRKEEMPNPVPNWIRRKSEASGMVIEGGSSSVLGQTRKEVVRAFATVAPLVEGRINIIPGGKKLALED